MTKGLGEDLKFGLPNIGSYLIGTISAYWIHRAVNVIYEVNELVIFASDDGYSSQYISYYTTTGFIWAQGTDRSSSIVFAHRDLDFNGAGLDADAISIGQLTILIVHFQVKRMGAQSDSCSSSLGGKR